MRTLSLMLLLVVALLGCNRPQQTHRPALVAFDGLTMGTSYDVKLNRLPGDKSYDDLQAEIGELLETVNVQMSTYRRDSELSQFNQAPAGEWFAVSPAVVQVVAKAMEISRATGGAFDVTAGPLVNLWHFGPDAGAHDLPSDEAIAAAQELVDYRKLAVRREPPALKKQLDGAYVDLSAIAKGYGVDRVAEHLEQLGVDAYLVEIGGEVRTLGTKPDGGPWRVAIERPLGDARGIYTVLGLSGESLATSGGYRNFYEIDGRRYSHTIDPRTGRPIKHSLASASVIAENCMTADAWATALMVLGPDEGYNLAREAGLAVLLLMPENGDLTEKVTPDFQSLRSSAGVPR